MCLEWLKRKEQSETECGPDNKNYDNSSLVGNWFYFEQIRDFSDKLETMRGCLLREYLKFLFFGLKKTTNHINSKMRPFSKAIDGSAITSLNYKSSEAFGLFQNSKKSI